MRVCIGQIAPIVGDVAGNGARVRSVIREAIAGNARVVLLPELTLCGYPPRDLVSRKDLVAACRAEAEGVAAATAGSDIIAIFGSPWEAGGLRNSAVIAWHGEIVAVRHKTLLPTYDIFDEGRYFVPETAPRLVDVGGLTLAVTVCEDLWNEPGMFPGHNYAIDPVARLAGADLMVNLSASPFHRGKTEVRRKLVMAQAVQARSPVVYCNQVGGNDELVFDGASLASDAQGNLLAQLPQFSEHVAFVDTDGPTVVVEDLPFEAEVLEALILGVRDYGARSGFKGALVGLSGGIDSALVLYIATRAFGAENCLAIGMPGPFSSPGSVTDAKALAETLGVRFEIVPIAAVHDQYLQALAPLFAGLASGLAEENLQARERGAILMALSNKLGHLVLTTGNKSEVAVGYCTLYGDMCGGLSVLSDVFKTDVYRICRYINRDGVVIPVATLTKPPSAELAPNQTDQDSLPPYDVLDAILALYVEEERGPAEIIAAGFDAALVKRVIGLVVRSEYKRLQAAPGLRVTSRAFGSGRRFPLAQKWT